MTPSHFSSDVLEFLKLMEAHKVRYVIVGGEAVIYHGHVRLTGDVDFFFDGSSENAAKLFDALVEFWGGEVPAVTSARDLEKPGVIVQFGRPPNRIDLLNTITAVPFQRAWDSRVEEKILLGGETHPVYYIGLDALIANKQAVGRPKDLEDLKYLDTARNKQNDKSPDG